MPVLSAQFVRVSAYIRGVLRTTRPTSFGSGYADLDNIDEILSFSR